MPDSFTPTQQKILDVLSDGKSHSRQELIDCLEDAVADRKNLNVHLSNLRARMRPAGHDVIYCPRHRKAYYRHVVLISGDDGG